MHDDTARTTEKKDECDKHVGRVAVEILSVWTPQIEVASRNKTGGENNTQKARSLYAGIRTVD